MDNNNNSANSADCTGSTGEREHLLTSINQIESETCVYDTNGERIA